MTGPFAQRAGAASDASSTSSTSPASSAGRPGVRAMTFWRARRLDGHERITSLLRMTDTQLKRNCGSLERLP
ncbi:hypothetical protein [Streptomyces yangpuensis]|uniref:hypothetical protein n=1 Tax=Streptomyces yangpuensis TaxID=1648182 RepID=UPI00371DE260